SLQNLSFVFLSGLIKRSGTFEKVFLFLWKTLLKMRHWELCPFSVTPAAAVLSRCVSRGALAQELLDSASTGLRPTFSPQLQEAEERIRMQKHLDELRLKVELLNLEKKSADVTHKFHLARRFQVLQMLCTHLQNVLKNQSSLRQRLMRPLGRTNLPIQAHLHRFVVDLVDMLPNFIRKLEEMVASLRRSPTAEEHLAQLDTSLAQLLARVVEVEDLSDQVLRWQDSSRSGDGTS
uniref:HAUS augmin like complex subunit 2 n=1 Tax=Tetraodon nigroviridis TaxID=99883 RepID=H3C2E4_TETNG